MLQAVSIGYESVVLEERQNRLTNSQNEPEAVSVSVLRFKAKQTDKGNANGTGYLGDKKKSNRSPRMHIEQVWLRLRT